MSSAERSPNQDTIEQTKAQIRGLVGEIVQISKSDLGPEQYYPAVLHRIVQALAAVGGAVWTLDENRSLKLIYQEQVSDTLLEPQSEDAVRHSRLLDYITQSRQPQLIPPLSGMSDERAGGNPTRYLLVLAPLQSDNVVEGVIEIFQRPDSQPATQRGYLKFLMQMCEQISEWLKTRKLRQFSDRHSLWAQADQFSRVVHDSLDLHETAFTIVNEARRLIGCDRVSLALDRGGKCKIEAVSGQDTLDNRANIVTGLGELSTLVVATGEALHYTGSTTELPPQLEEKIHDYVEESYAKSITILPLRKPGEMQNSGDKEIVQRDLSHNREILGALIIEQIESDLPQELIEPRIDLVYEHTARAVSNCLAYNNLFLMPVWRAIGKASWIVKARTLPKTITISIAILILIIGMFVVPYPYKMKAEGALQPVIRREVFVETAGTIDKVHVKDGDLVKEGEPLVEMSNPELAAEMEKLLGSHRETRQQLDSVEYGKKKRDVAEADLIKLSGQSRQLRQRLESLEKQMDLIKQKHDKLLIRSPITGTVVLSWDIEKSLLHRPVETGQSLMSVADTSTGAEWELELFMSERYMEPVNEARKTIKEDLDVSYVLATDPHTEHKGQVRAVHERAELDAEHGHCVRVRVQLAELSVTDPRPGATVTAHVYCGRKSIGRYMFYDFIWSLRNFMFRYL